MTTVVGFGRRVGTGDLLPEPTWAEFRADVLHVVTYNGGEVVFSGEGVGVYKGVVEPSACVVFTGGVATDIHAALANIAVRYGQDSIAVTNGETAFVGA